MNRLTSHKRILTSINVIIVVGLIWLYHFGFLGTISFGEFLVGVVAVFVGSIYNPVIAFVFFVGVIPLEIIDISSQNIDLVIRPYQLMGVILFSAVFTRKIFGVSDEQYFRWNIFDTLIAVFVSLGFVVVFLNGEDTYLKQSIVVASFALLYFVVRMFVQSKKDVLALFPIIVSSGVVVSVYAIMQNILFNVGGNHLEIMPGRPNATFAEPDWLGVYIVFLIATSLAYLYYNTYHKHIWKFFDITLFVAMSIFFTALIITVARSAWMGVAAVVLTYSIILFFQKKYKLFVKHTFWIFSTALLSLIIVFLFGLTTFELGNRLQSTNTGLQEITVSCSDKSRLVTTLVINDVSELEQYNCRHINLEEIESEKAIGNEVIKIHRPDPNVSVRADVYKKTIEQIQLKPWFGYGWGSSGKILGNDENGTPLNASNIFLETTLSIGIVGVTILIMIFVTIGFFAIKVLRTSSSMKEKSVVIFALLGTVAIIVPNLFNAGLLLGFVWLFFGSIAILRNM